MKNVNLTNIQLYNYKQKYYFSNLDAQILNYYGYIWNF